MAFADTAPLIAVLKLDDKFSGPLKNAQRTLGGFDAKLGQIGPRARLAGQQIGTGLGNGLKIATVGLVALSTQIAAGVNSLFKVQDAQAQTNAVIQSTQGVAKVAATEVRRLAEQYEALNATIGDETIQQAENLLLTFTNVRKEAFEPTLKVALDMNQALRGGEGGLAGNMKLLGKALQDPERGLARLGRAVGGFSDETTAAVKAAVKQNDTLKAQSIILAELNRRFGGSFAAGGTTDRAKVASFTDAWEDLTRVLATGALPVIGKVATRLQSLLASHAVIKGAQDLGDSIAGLFTDENLTAGANVLKGLFNAAKAAAPAIQQAAEVTGRIIGTAVDLFRSLPPEIQSLAVAGLAINKLTGGLVTNIAGGLISSVLKQLVSGVVNVTGATVIVNGGIGSGGIPPAAVGGGGLLAGAAGLIIPVSIAAITVAAAGALANAIDPGATAQGQETLFNRDPRRFNSAGIPVRNSVPRDLATGQDIRNVITRDDMNTTRTERATIRAANIARLASARIAAEARLTTAAIKAKDMDPKVTVNTSVAATTYLNGRLVLSDLSRYSSTVYVGSGKVAGLPT